MPHRWTAFIAMTAAALMLAHQVAGKAVRDSFFLSNFPASDLPKAVLAAVVVSVLFVLIFARLLSRFGPAVLVPAGFLISAALHSVEYLHVQDSPKIWSLVIYFHIVSLGAILLSGFWSLMTEAFDPRAAKRVFGRIAGIGTLGGIAGGLTAERLAVHSSAASVLLFLAASHLVCSIVLACARHQPMQASPSRPREFMSPVKLFHRAPYLGVIALVVVAGTSSATMLDYLFKAYASKSIVTQMQLLRFFAVFYTGTQILTFFAQTLLARRALQRLGIGRTIATLPLGVGAGALCALVVSVFSAFTFAAIRSLELVLRGSLFRSAYELLYTPIPKNEKRAAKTMIDVAFDRAGDALGSGLVQLLLWLAPSFVTKGLLGIALAFAAAALFASRRLDAAYSRQVQQRLVDRAVEFDLEDIEDSTTRSVLIPVRAAQRAREAAGAASLPAADETLDLMRELRSGDSLRVIAAARLIGKPVPVIAAQLVHLLAWDEVSKAAREALLRNPTPHTGLLVDHLINPEVPFEIRRRIPRVLVGCDSQLAVHGLLSGLEDARFEVRFQCSRALDLLVLRRPELKVPPDAVFAAAERELRVALPIWKSRRSLDKRPDADAHAYLDDILRERADQSLEHVFSLFAAVLPREPVKIAFRALHTEDKTLRSLAMEYLDSILPQNIRERLWIVVESGVSRKPPSKDSGQAALDQLLRSHESLLLMVKKT